MHKTENLEKAAAPVFFRPGLADFIGAPFRLPDSNAPTDELLHVCTAAVDELLNQAKHQGILPQQVLGVLYLSLTPKTGDLLSDSRLVWWGSSQPHQLGTLAAYAYASRYNRIYKRSFYQIIPREKKWPAGWLALFSCGCAGTYKLPEFNFLHIALPACELGKFRFLDKASLPEAIAVPAAGVQGLRHFVFEHFLEKNAGILEIPTPVSLNSSDITCCGDPCDKIKGTSDHADKDLLTENDFETFRRMFLADTGYFNHILPGVQRAFFLQCAPEVFTFFQSKDRSWTGAETGIGFILQRQPMPTDDDLRTCYWVAFKIAAVLSPLHWLIRARLEEEKEKEGRKRAAEAYRFVAHSLHSSLRRMEAMDSRVTPLARLEWFALRAGEVYSIGHWSPGEEDLQWQHAGVNREDLDKTLCAAIFETLSHTICSTEIKERIPDPRLIATITELARNLNHHSASQGTISLHPGTEKGTVHIHVRGACQYGFPAAIEKLLKAPGDLTGLQHTWNLVRSMTTAATKIVYFFTELKSGESILSAEPSAENHFGPVHLELRAGKRVIPVIRQAIDTGDISRLFAFEIRYENINGLA